MKRQFTDQDGWLPESGVIVAVSTPVGHPHDATPEQCIAAWLDLMDACEQLLLSGLRREIGPEGDLRAAYRRWYTEQMHQHDRTMLRMVEEFNRRGGDDAR